MLENKANVNFQKNNNNQHKFYFFSEKIKKKE